MSLSHPAVLPRTDLPRRSGRGTCGSHSGTKTAALRRAAILVPLVCLLLCGSAAGIEAALGETVHLAGTSYGGPYVYLFLTGPNLPSDGVALDDVTLPANQGGLTRVSVGDNDRWEYDWDTHATGGRLDEGTYTVWITTIPAGRSGLVSGEYRTLSVTLRSPGLSLTTPARAGAISFTSIPSGASVIVDGRYRGTTPLDLPDLSPGTYNVTISSTGYRSVDLPVTVEAGAMTEAAATLVPLTGSIAVVTDPPGARVLLDGYDAGSAPLVIGSLAPGGHTVFVQLDGYVPAGENVTVTDARTENVTLALVPVETPAHPTYAGSPGPGILAAGTCALLFAALTRGRRR